MQVPNHPTITTNGVLRPTQVYVNLNRIAANFRSIQEHVGATEIMPIVKANAYGHGLVEVSRHLVQNGAKTLGVAFLEEGVLLRESGITQPILVLGGVIGNQVPTFIQYNLTLTASSVEKLEHIDQVASTLGKQAKVHLKVDTGMERIGVHYYSAESLLQASLKCRHTTIEGIFSHFANADDQNLASAKLQLERFLEVLNFYDQHSLPPPIRHIANSGAILQLPESCLDMVRPGIILYGVYPSGEVKKAIEISPALSWHSRVVFFKVVQPGHPVSYGSTWQTDHQIRLVTVPVGYGDGYFRSMSGNAEVLIRGKRYPTVGRICMDQVMVNIEWETAYNNDEVVLIGSQDQESISVEDLAEWAGTIPYEILTNINTRVPRIYQPEETNHSPMKPPAENQTEETLNQSKTGSRTWQEYATLLLGAGTIIALDQFTKGLILEYIPFLDSWLPDWLSFLAPYFRFVHWRNSGAAFGLFQNGNLIFMILAALAAIFIVALYPSIEKREWSLRTAMIFQLGGAVGNLIDRIRFGYVIDFLSVGDFPVFNLADASISIGVAILLLDVVLLEWREYKRKLSENSEQPLERRSP